MDLRRRAERIGVALRGVLARGDGRKHPMIVLDVGRGGMHVQADVVPEYGETVQLVVQLDEETDWLLFRGQVRWFASRGFGVEFQELAPTQVSSLERFLDPSAA